MQILTIVFTLSLLSSAVVADTCYYDDFNNWVCRDGLNIGARVAIAAVSFLIVSGIVLGITMRRRRRIAQINLAYAQAAQNQQQGYPSQYPPQPQGGFFGAPFGGKPPAFSPQQQNDPQQTGQYAPQQTGQYDPQQNPHHNTHLDGQHHPQFSPPQYPPTTYDQNQPVPPYSNFATPV